jgi:predicted transposase YbfD/YdcC
MKSVQKITEGEILAIDGKTLRGSYDTGSEKAAIHMVNAWAVHNRLVMGQLKVDSKSNEITAIPELLKVLEMAGCIVTIDAMGCQKEIVKEIVRQKADYVITLKENQGNLYKDVEELVKIGIQTEFQGLEYSKYTIKYCGHGREEIRHYMMISGIKSQLDINSEWVNLNSVGMVEHIRKEKGETTVEIRYFISSLANNAEKFATAVRGQSILDFRF